MCGEENEDMMHMLTCEKYPQCFITEIIDTIPNLPTKWEWLFHYDRSSEIRVKTSRWIHSRWRAREHIILRACEREPDVTGDIVTIFPLDRGTEVEATNPRNPVEHDSQIQPNGDLQENAKLEHYTPNDNEAA